MQGKQMRFGLFFLDEQVPPPQQSEPYASPPRLLGLASSSDPRPSCSLLALSLSLSLSGPVLKMVLCKVINPFLPSTLLRHHPS
jgi:hypothetical protein